MPVARSGRAAGLVRRSRRSPARRPHSAAGLIFGAIGAGLLAVVLVVAAGAGLTGLVAVSSITVLSAGLPDPADLGDLSFSEPTIVYDRTGKVELARFQQERRRVLTYDQIPPLVLDATTGAEDRTFWTNQGFDLPAMANAAVDTLNGAGRGASTITQQLVRARLLPEDVIAPGADVYLRKAKEVIQAARLTQAFPGEPGKQQIITAYLNEIFYGHDAYGIAAAANAYFGVSDLSKLTPAQAALLAGAAPVAVDARPVPVRRQGQEGAARRPPGRPAGRAPQLDPREPRGGTLDPPVPGDDRRGVERSPSSCAATARSCSRPRTSRGRSVASWSRSSARATPSRPAATG